MDVLNLVATAIVIASLLVMIFGIVMYNMAKKHSTKTVARRLARTGLLTLTLYGLPLWLLLVAIASWGLAWHLLSIVMLIGTLVVVKLGRKAFRHFQSENAREQRQEEGNK